MAQTDERPRYPDSQAEPWTCDFCGWFLYNLDNEGYPTDGSPIPNFVDGDFKQVCSLCYSIARNKGFDTDYWRELHRKWAIAQEQRKRDNDRLTGRRDYFS